MNNHITPNKSKGGRLTLRLFLTMLKIGAFTFGGGYAMIALLENEFVSKRQWMEKEEFLDMVAIAESTPGPIAVNMATFVGSSQGGVLGAMLATLGVVLPSFFIILLISTLMKNFLKYKPVKAFLRGVRPCVIALILATALTMLLSSLFAIKTLKSTPRIDPKALLILALLVAITWGLKRFAHKKPSPILTILISAGLGILFYI